MSRNLLLLIAVLILGGAALVMVGIQSDSSHSQAASPEMAHSATSSVPVMTPTTTEMASSTNAVSVLHFEVVTSAAAQERGLGGRSVIPDNYAMLFVFSEPDTYGFWMKDMLVPIDMIWLSNKGTIIKIDASVSPDTYPKAFYPPAPVEYVLETKAGFSAEHGWNVGTHVALPLPYGK